MSDERMASALKAVAGFARTVMRADVTNPRQRDTCYARLWQAAVAILEADPVAVDEYIVSLRQAAIREGLRPSSVDAKLKFARQRAAVGLVEPTGQAVLFA